MSCLVHTMEASQKPPFASSEHAPVEYNGYQRLDEDGDERDIGVTLTEISREDVTRTSESTEAETSMK